MYWINRLRCSFLLRFIAASLAITYVAFQVEPFSEEYTASHPQNDGSLCFSKSSLNWETFDKQNAPKAFTCDAPLRISFLLPLIPEPTPEYPANHPFQLIRDKSPPHS